MLWLTMSSEEIGLAHAPPGACFLPPDAMAINLAARGGPAVLPVAWRVRGEEGTLFCCGRAPAAWQTAGFLHKCTLQS